MIFESRLQSINRAKYILLMTCTAVVLKVALYIIFDSLYKIGNNEIVGKLVEETDTLININTLIFTGVILAPIIETFIGQALPIKTLSIFTKNDLIKFIGSVIIFTFLHDISNILTGASVGSVLAYSYLLKAKVSMKEAFLTTTAIHFLHNLIAVILLIIFK